MYVLRYTKYINTPQTEWVLNIYQDRENAVDAVAIGPVLQGLRLVVQGDQADIDTPIIKTSLEMTFVDAYDLDNDKKNGGWEEFYTSSATEWKVELVDETRMQPIWTGYITPDSFSEDLRYRGSVTLIARDNLGTLQDTTCDCTDIQNKDGKVFIYDLIDKALAVSGCAMPMSYDLDSFPFAADNQPDAMWKNGGNALWHLVDAGRLGELNWWEALEKVLYSIGACLRYVGENRLVLVPLRDIPKLDAQEWWDVPTKVARFLAFGHRELVPGVKAITETNEWNAEAEAEPEQVGDYNSTATLACQNITLVGPTGASIGPDFNVPAWGYRNLKEDNAIIAGNSALLNVGGYARLRGEDSDAYGAWDDRTIVYYALNARQEKPLSFSREVYSPSVKTTIGFIVDKAVTLTQTYSQVMNLPVENATEYGTDPTVQMQIVHTDRATGAVKYYTGNGWSSSAQSVSKAFGIGLITADKPQGATTIEIKDIEVPAAGTLTLTIQRIYIRTLKLRLRYNCVGVFLRLRDFRMQPTIPDDIALTKRLTLTTNYSDRYAVRLTREPEFSVNATELPEVAYIPNAILNEGAYQYRGLSDWIWLHGRDATGTLPQHTGISLSRLIHQQLLAYHASPNNLLTGELVDVDHEHLFSTLYEWGGVKHLLLSGTYNVLTGRMENAVLRSFARYDQMWEAHIEGEDVFEVPKNSGYQYIEVTIVSDNTLTASSFSGGQGLTLYGFVASGKRYRATIEVAPNAPTQVVTFDRTARVLIKRESAGEQLSAADGLLTDSNNEQIYTNE